MLCYPGAAGVLETFFRCTLQQSAAYSELCSACCCHEDGHCETLGLTCDAMFCTTELCSCCSAGPKCISIPAPLHAHSASSGDLKYN